MNGYEVDTLTHLRAIWVNFTDLPWWLVVPIVVMLALGVSSLIDYALSAACWALERFRTPAELPEESSRDE